MGHLRTVLKPLSGVTGVFVSPVLISHSSQPLPNQFLLFIAKQFMKRPRISKRAAWLKQNTWNLARNRGKLTNVYWCAIVSDFESNIAILECVIVLDSHAPFLGGTVMRRIPLHRLWQGCVSHLYWIGLLCFYRVRPQMSVESRGIVTHSFCLAFMQ